MKSSVFISVVVSLIFLSISQVGWSQSDSFVKLSHQPNTPFAELLVFEIFDQYPILGPKNVSDELQKTIALKKLPVLARDRARYLLAKLYLWTGATKKSKMIINDMGFITDWRFVGPFSNESDTGLHTEFSLENSNSPFSGQSMTMPLNSCNPTRDGGVCEFDASWLSISLGKNTLQHLFSPSQNICVYAQTQIKTKSHAETMLLFGSAGQSKVFLNGTAILTETHHFGADINRYQIPVKLHSGKNILTVKNCANATDELSFFARFSATKGNLDPFEINSNNFQTPLVFNVQKKRKAVEHSSAVDKLVVAANDTRSSANTKGSIAAYALRTGTIDETKTVKEMARQACVATALMKHCSTYEKLTQDANEKRFAYQTVLQRHPENVDAQIAINRINMTILGLYDTQTKIMRLSAEFPQNPLLHCLVLKQYIKALPLTAMAYQRKLKTTFSIPIVHKCVAESSIGQPTHADSISNVKDATKIDYTNFDFHLYLLELQIAAKPQTALDTVSRFMEIGAPPKDAMLRLLSLLDGAVSDAANSTALTSLLTELQTKAPAVWEYQQEMGLRLLRSGQRNKGIQQLQLALRMSPQNQELREMLSFLKPTTAFYKSYVISPETFLSKDKQCHPKAEQACFLVDNTVLNIHESGLSSRFTQVVVKVGNKDAAHEWQQYSEQFSSGQQITVLAARIFRKDGQIEEATGRATFPVSEPWYRLFYDIETEVVELPSLNAGDVVEYQFRIDDIAGQNQFGGYFGTVLSMNRFYPTAFWQAVIVRPPSLQLFFDLPNFLQRNEVQKDNTIVTELRAHSLEKISSEPDMPNPISVSSQVHMSTYRHWHEMENWYRTLVQPQLVQDASIRNKVQKITRNLHSENEKIAAIYNWVVENIRYVGLEFGIHGYKPYATPQIFARGFGDCKDTASLLVMMLKQIGVDAKIALVRTQSAGTVKMSIPSLSVFNHALVYIPKHDLWLDGTATQHGTNDFPFEDQGIPALLINSTPVSLRTTPINSPEDAQYHETQAIVVEPNGNATIDFSISASGAPYAPWLRKQFSGDNAKKTLEKHLSSQFVGVEILDVSFKNLKKLEKQPQILLTGTVPHFASSENSTLSFNAVPPLFLKKKFAKLKKRKYPLIMGPKKTTTVQSTYVVSPEYTVQTKPKSAQIESQFGTFAFEIRLTPKQVVAKRTLRLHKTTVSPDEYADFLRFCITVDSLLQTKIVMVKK